MKLHQLFSFFNFKTLKDEQKSWLDLDISGVFFDARQVTANSVFVAIKGHEKDGHDFIDQAIAQGAFVLIVENKSKVPENFPYLVIEHSDTRLFLDQLAARFYQFPSQELICLGVTGTNGKTSITYILEHILNENRKLTGVMGTVNHRVGAHVWTSQMTTPDPVTLQKRLREFVQEGAVCAAMEVSSHALDQRRVDSVHFNTVIFTNLTLDHLDYHKNMKNYFASKQRLFTEVLMSSLKQPQFAVINTDDTYGRQIQVAQDVICWTYGQKESDFQFKITQMNYSETTFDLRTPLDNFQVTVPVCGVHSVYNVVASIAAALSCGVSLKQAIDSLKSFQGVPGRLQKVISSSRKTVLVDYAHSPDALENVIKALIEIRRQSKISSRIITVFGCGGDRDTSKRPLMGEIATRLSDIAYVTSDNPRTENPISIIQQIQAGISPQLKNYHIEVDREVAIQKALAEAGDEDVVLIAGKGHEDYQIIGTEKKHFSDFEVAQKYLV